MAPCSANNDMPSSGMDMNDVPVPTMDSSALGLASQQHPGPTWAVPGGHALNSLGANTSSSGPSTSHHPTATSTPLEANVFAGDEFATRIPDILRDPVDPSSLHSAYTNISAISRNGNVNPATLCGSHLEVEGGERPCSKGDCAQKIPVTSRHAPGRHDDGDDIHTTREHPSVVSLETYPGTKCVDVELLMDRKAESHEGRIEYDALETRQSLAILYIRKPHSSWYQDLYLDRLPNEILMHILGFLEVCDLLATSRTNHHLRSLSLHPTLHHRRLRHVRLSILPSLLFASPNRPSLADLIARRIFQTRTARVSRQLSRSLVTIKLSRRLPLRPSAASLVQRGVLPGEVVEGHVAPALVARSRAVERERLKDGLRNWVGAVWRGRVKEREEGLRRWDESRGVGRVWKLRRFWERLGQDGGGSV